MFAFIENYNWHKFMSVKWTKKPESYTLSIVMYNFSQIESLQSIGFKLRDGDSLDRDFLRKNYFQNKAT